MLDPKNATLPIQNPELWKKMIDQMVPGKVDWTCDNKRKREE
jgi:hypothetical protein